MLNRGLSVTLLMVLALSLGCAADNSHLAKPTETVTWPALKALNDPSVSMGLVMPAQMGDFKTCRKNAADSKLADLVSAFEAEAIPEKFKSTAREAAKQKIVTAYKAIMLNAKSNGSDKDLKLSLEDVKSGMASVIDPNLK